MNKLSSFVKKGEKLLEEAELDLINGCFNKAVSAYYFAVEAFANAIFYAKKQKTRGFRSRIGIIKNIFDIEIVKKYEKLHDLRRRADHEDILMSEIDAKEARALSMEIIKTFQKYISKNLGLNF